MVGGIEQITTIAAPVLSGLAIAALEPDAIFLLIAGLFLASAAAIATIPSESAHDRGVLRISLISSMIRDGFRITLASRTLRDGAMLFAATNFSINLFQANAVFFVLDRFALEVVWVGVFFSLAGIGAVSGAVIAPTLVRRVDCGRLIAGCTVLAGLATLPMAMTADFWSSALSWAVASAFGAVNVVAYFTYRQKTAPPEMLGQSVAITRLIAFSTIPIAALTGGLLYESTGPVFVILLCGRIRILAGLIAGRALIDGTSEAAGKAEQGLS